MSDTNHISVVTEFHHTKHAPDTQGNIRLYDSAPDRITFQIRKPRSTPKARYVDIAGAYIDEATAKQIVTFLLRRWPNLLPTDRSAICATEFKHNFVGGVCTKCGTLFTSLDQLLREGE